MKFIFSPTVRLVARPSLDQREINAFVEENFIEAEVNRGHQAQSAGDALPEVAGRICYMSFGKPRPGGNSAYLDNIKDAGHGSVLEHPNWSFIFEGISRSLSHELVRHRAGMAYSQLSQRYVDESDVNFVVPPALAREVRAANAYLDSIALGVNQPPLSEEARVGMRWLHACRVALQSYTALSEKLAKKAPETLSGTDRRKWARQAARSVLPNCTETKILVTGNARALRHCIEMRAAAAADVEIRALFVAVLRILQDEAPNLFGDYSIVLLPDGTEAAETKWRKV